MPVGVGEHLSPTLSAGVNPALTTYTEYGALRGTVKDDADGIRAAAEQFESIFVHMWLKAARDANRSIAADNPFSSNEMELHQDMLDQQMALHLANTGGIGLTEVIVRQLGGEPEPVTRTVSDAPLPEISRNGTRSEAFADAKDFLSTLMPMVDSATSAAGLPSLAVIGQAALETGWGRYVPTGANGSLSHNLFGMKAHDWSGPSVEIHSKEFELGQWIDRLSAFRSYPDWMSSVRDYVDAIVESPRYEAAREQGSDVNAYLHALQRGGYATDPGYADKVIAVIGTIKRMID